MPRRDPDTGKFVSGGSVTYDDVHTVTGSMTTTIPAADLGGGTTKEAVTGEAAELIDMSGKVDSDETFEVLWLEGTITLSMPTTATAEGTAQLEWALKTDLGAEAGVGTAFHGAASNDVGIADVNHHITEDDALISMGRLTAAASVADSTNGLGAGAEDGYERLDIPFMQIYGSGPRLDEDDELTLPHTLAIDNVSDHAVVATFDFAAHGIISD